jgi:hypothetical protein
MVNFHDPAVEVTDSCAYGFAAISGSCEYTECTKSHTLEVLARCGWSLYVGLLGTNLWFLQSITNLKATFPAGSFSRLLTLSGVSSKDVVTTGGRSGSVMIPSFFKNP